MSDLEVPSSVHRLPAGEAGRGRAGGDPTGLAGTTRLIGCMAEADSGLSVIVVAGVVESVCSVVSGVEVASFFFSASLCTIASGGEEGRGGAGLPGKDRLSCAW